MPKLKTHRGAAKRFKRAANGRIKRYSANRRHILSKIKRKVKRHLRAPNAVHASDAKAVNRMLTGS